MRQKGSLLFFEVFGFRGFIVDEKIVHKKTVDIFDTSLLDITIKNLWA